MYLGSYRSAQRLTLSVGAGLSQLAQRGGVAAFALVALAFAG
jgi:hypothetical protein